MRPCVYLRGRSGLGDAIYLRPIARVVAKTHHLYLGTAWPELYADLSIRFVAPNVRQRAVAQQIARQPADRWSTPPCPVKRVHYQWDSLGERSILSEIEYRAGVQLEDPRLDLPPLGASPVDRGRVAVIRPVTVRKDWPNPARNPDPSYIHAASLALIELGYHVVSVADADPVEEPVCAPAPEAHTRYERGELGVRQLLALVRDASIAVGGAGWIVPAALATRTPLVMVGGGHGKANHPHVLADSRLDSSRVRWILPDEYCRCDDRQHGCRKTITNFDGRFLQAVSELT